MKDFSLYYTKNETKVRVVSDSKNYFYEVEKGEKEEFIFWVKNTFCNSSNADSIEIDVYFFDENFTFTV